MKQRRFQGYLTIKEEEALYLLRSLSFFGMYLLITYTIGLVYLFKQATNRNSVREVIVRVGRQR